MHKIGEFEIVRELGRGGTSIVYEAIEDPLSRPVALKILRKEWAARPDGYQRFVGEAKKIAKLSHPSIVKIYRFGQIDDIYFLALEYVEGEPLDKVLASEKLSPYRTVVILKEVAEALAHAHKAGIIHRDIKPGNILMSTDGRVVLGDFGIAKDLDPSLPGITDPNIRIGTPAYMSPKQGLAQEQTISPATDIYAFGVMAFEMLTGRVPFTASSARDILHKHASEPPPRILDIVTDIPEGLIELVEQMLEKAPARRPQNGKQVAEALVEIQEEMASTMHLALAKRSEPRRPPARGSLLEEMEITLVGFDLIGFSQDFCQRLLPARVGFLLENWYRLARQAVSDYGGIIDRYIGDRVTAVFGFQLHHNDHVQCALRAVQALKRALAAFNLAYDLDLCMRAGIACDLALVGRIPGDSAPLSIQGRVQGDMAALTKTKLVGAPIRLNRTAYRRVSGTVEFIEFDEPR